jgi:hypothetical protein
MLRSWIQIPLLAWMFDVYVCLFCVCYVLCLGRGLETSWSFVQGVLLLQLAPKPIVGLGLMHQQSPGVTNLVHASHINVIYQSIISQWDQIGYPRPCFRLLNWYVLHDEVIGLMCNPYQEDQAVFGRGPIPLAPVVLTTVAGQQRRFWSAPSILFPRYSPPI